MVALFVDSILTLGQSMVPNYGMLLVARVANGFLIGEIDFQYLLEARFDKYNTITLYCAHRKQNSSNQSKASEQYLPGKLYQQNEK